MGLTEQEQLQEDLELLYTSRRKLYNGHQEAALGGNAGRASTIWEAVVRVDEAILRCQQEIAGIY